jgi:hypothetical protein
MVKHHKNTKGSQDSKSYPTLNTPKDGRGKYGTENGARINQGTQEMTEDECEKKKNKWEVVRTFHGRNS